MATTAQLMASGIPPQAALMLATGPITTLTPAGASQGTAPIIASPGVILGTAGAAGVILPSAVGQPEITVFNNSGAAQNVYPAVGQTINALTANTAFSVPTGKAAQFLPGDTGWLANVSA